MEKQKQLQRIKEARETYTEPLWKDWTIGSQDFDGEEIKNIIEQSNYFIVYYVNPGWLKWEYINKCIYYPHKLINETQILLHDGKNAFKDKQQLAILKDQIAADLAHAFEANGFDCELADLFKNSRSIVKEKSEYKSKAHYFYISISFTLLFWCITFLISTLNNKELFHLAIGGAGGALGSYISTMQRFGQIKTEKRWIVHETLSRLVMGSVFGIVWIICQKTNIIFGFLSGNNYFLALGGIMAGLNERFIPTLLSKAESSINSNCVEKK